MVYVGWAVVLHIIPFLAAIMLITACKPTIHEPPRPHQFTTITPDTGATCVLARYLWFEHHKPCEVDWFASEATLLATCQWNTEEEPRLSPSQAIKIARKSLRSSGHSDTLPVLGVDMRSPIEFDSSGHCFFYVIEFYDHAQKSPPPEVVQVVILLDGTVVNPVRSTK